MKLRSPAACLVLGAADAGSSSVTFTRDVAPVLYKRCLECHRKGEVAGIAFTTYKEVRPWAKAIKDGFSPARCHPGWPIRTMANFGTTAA